MKFKLYTFITIVILIVLSFLPVKGELDLQPRNPDEPGEYTFNERFSLESALHCIEYVKKALTSFRILTERVENENKLSKEEIAKIGNTDWETQNLGFFNMVGAIEGTLRKQNYIIQKLEFELAKEKLKSGKIKKENLKQKEIEYKNAEKEFQKFWDSFGIAD